MSKIYFCAEDKSALPPTGLEPAIPGLGGRCLIHWATEAYIMMILNIDVFCDLSREIFATTLGECMYYSAIKRMSFFIVNRIED